MVTTVTEEQTDTLKSAFKTLMKLAHASIVLTRTAQVEAVLQRLLETRMPNLSNRLREKLFTGYGPFSSLSAKIDTLFAMGMLTEELRRELHVVRELRNLFAHSPKHLRFKSKGMPEIFAKFRDYKPDQEKLEFFNKKAIQLHRALEKIEEPHLRAKLLMADAPKA